MTEANSRRIRGWKWHFAAKLGFWLVRLWAEEQYQIDDDAVQTSDVIHEMLDGYLDC